MRPHVPVMLAAAMLLAACAATDAQEEVTASAAPPAPVSVRAAEASAPTPSVVPVTLKSSIPAGKTVAADATLKVGATSGQISDVEVTGGPHPVDGTVSAGVWTASTPLSPGARYHVVGTVTTPGGPVQRSFAFTTKASTRRLGIDVTPNEGTRVGIAQPIALRFNGAVASKQEVIDALQVQTIPATEGSWRWISDVELHWRPAAYWAPGTQVTLDADLRGIDLGGGVYANSAFTQSFSIGRAQVMKINARSKMMKFYRDGKVVRTVPVSLGKPGFETRSGTKVILERYKVKRMTSTEVGESYDLQVPYAMRMTWSGEFLHAAPWAAARLGRINGSHGCTNVGLADGKWLFSHVQAGDPVVTVGTKRRMELGNGYGDWNLSWDSWRSSTGA